MGRVVIPRVLIDVEALERIQGYTEAAEGEVSGLGRATLVDGTGILVSDVELLPQTCTGSSTEIDEGALGRFLYRKFVDGESDQWKVWWHSHGLLEPFWSATDEDTIGRFCDGGWLVSIVTCKDHAMRVRVDVFEPIPITIHDIDFVPVATMSRLERRKYAAQVDEKVTHGRRVRKATRSSRSN